ncbi:MAG TPA: alpha/beta hydrolase [Pseudomonadales bacterium]
MIAALLAGLLAGCAALSGERAVDRDEYLPVADARLYMVTRGEDAAAPLLVWLHGGPGGAERPLFRLYNAPLERHFLVVYFDQRGTGRSYDPDANPARLTIARHLEDLDAVVRHLLDEFDRRRVILVGHSWGSALGLLYAEAHPANVAAFVGVGQFTSELDRQRAQYRFVQTEAQERGDEGALREIESIGPPPFTAERELAIQGFVNRYGGYWRDPPNRFALLLRGFFRGYVMPWELPRMIRANNVSLEAMNDELLALDLRERVSALEVPVVFMLGRYDRQVDARLAAAWFEQLSAPAKRLMWFDTAHNIPFEAPERFNAALPQLLAAVGAVSL